IPRGATIFVENSEEPNLWWYFGNRGLFQLAYDDDTIDVLYTTRGDSLLNDLFNSKKLIVMKYHEGLRDITSAFRANPCQVMTCRSEENFTYVTSDVSKLELIPSVIKAGTGSYRISIAGAYDAEVELQYHLNDGPLSFIRVKLNGKGETRFFVSSE